MEVLQRHKKYSVIFQDGYPQSLESIYGEKKAFYGLTFERKFQNMYTIENCKEENLSVMGTSILLTITFLVGKYDDPFAVQKTLLAWWSE